MRKTALLVLVSIASAQTGSAFARTLFDDLGAAGVTVLRLAIGSVVLALLTRPRLRTWPAASWRAAILLGAAIAGLNLNSYLALRTVPLGVCVPVTFIGPLLLVLVQTRRLVDLVWALLAGGGVGLLGLSPGVSAPIGGLLLALCAGLCGAGYIFFSARLGGLVPGAGGLPVSLAVGFLVVLPFGASGASAVFTHPALLLGGAVVALLSGVVPAGLEINVLRHLPTRVFAVLMSLQPAGGALAGWLVLRQRLGPPELTALAMVTLASIGVTLTHRPTAGPAGGGTVTMTHRKSEATAAAVEQDREA